MQGLRENGLLTNPATRPEEDEMVGKRCPDCGYTDLDKLIHGDHHLCKRAKFPTPAPAGQDGGWRTIETAPKDGTLILGWDNKIMRGKGAACVMGWFRNETTQKHEWMNFWNAYRVDVPCWWQPLPPPPAQET